MKNKRLFLIAGYSVNKTITTAFIHLVSSLSKFGDVVVCMDNDCPNTSELDKYTLHTITGHHGEYDFGSYKRAYLWAIKNLKLGDYDYLYLVNDSVYGPIFPIKQYLEGMESLQTDAFGLVFNPEKKHGHIQSWFIGTRRSVFCSDWFDTFICSVKKQADKGAITYLYEQGFTRLLTANNMTFDCLYDVSGRSIYNDIKKLYNNKLPFIKKNAFARHNGALGGQLLYVLNRVDKQLAKNIIDDANSIYGEKYIRWLLTSNAIKIMHRNITYFFHKLFSEGL